MHGNRMVSWWKTPNLPAFPTAGVVSNEEDGVA
jgi:hypothetical protein